MIKLSQFRGPEYLGAWNRLVSLYLNSSRNDGLTVQNIRKTQSSVCGRSLMCMLVKLNRKGQGEEDSWQVRVSMVSSVP